MDVFVFLTRSCLLKFFLLKTRVSAEHTGLFCLGTQNPSLHLSAPMHSITMQLMCIGSGCCQPLLIIPLLSFTLLSQPDFQKGNLSMFCIATLFSRVVTASPFVGYALSESTEQLFSCYQSLGQPNVILGLLLVAPFFVRRPACPNRPMCLLC